MLRPAVAHVHLKGLDRGELCEFGIGDVDLTPLVRRLVHEGYTGDFTVEYEDRSMERSGCTKALYEPGSPWRRTMGRIS